MADTYDINEVEQAFRDYWAKGAVGEDWDAWSDLFTEDVEYIEHVLGSKHGREEVRAWIKPIMAEFGEMYTAYEWHMCEPSGRIVVYMQNRRDEGQRTMKEYEEACAKHDPDAPKKRTRRHWGNGPDWTKGASTYAESAGAKKSG
jgi:SnoaL-like domain